MSTRSTAQRSARWKQGFTLIELILVIAILAILAGVVISRFGDVDRGAKLKASVASLGEMTRTMDIYKTVSKGKFPDGFDSLLDVDDTSAVYPGNGDAQENGGVWSGWLTVDGLTAGEYQSLLRCASNTDGPPPFGVQLTVYDHDTAATDANLSTADTAARVLNNTGNSNVAFVDPTTATGESIYEQFNLDASDTTFRLVALGIGPHCTLVGRNKFDVALAEAPLVDDPAPNADFAYRRIVLLFRVSGESQYFAEYVGAVTPYGKTAAALRTFVD